jgi:2-desacetyl-2-hydroxyethyl bacteriochlorophyllide A dehydrogenase
MRAAVLKAAQCLVVRDIARPVPDASEADVLVQIELAGVCGSDVALFLGRRPLAYPGVIGHEAIGRVVEPGRSELPSGTRVAIEPNIPCGHCSTCQRGLGNVCPQKRSLGHDVPGVFAEFVAVPAAFAHPVPDEIDAVDAVGLEPLAVAIHALRVGGVGSGDTVAVIGCGSEGLLLTQAAVAMGARVLAVDVRAGQLAVAERIGAEQTVVVAPGEDLERLGAQIAGEWNPAVVFECAGAAPAVQLALFSACVGGTVVLVGLADRPVPVVPLTFVRRGLRLLSSLIYDHPTDFRRAIDLVQGGRVRPGRLVTHVKSLDEAALALRLVADGRTGKLLLDVGGPLD